MANSKARVAAICGIPFAERVPDAVYTYRGEYLAQVLERAHANENVAHDLPWLIRPAGSLAAGGVITDEEAYRFADGLLGHLILKGAGLPPEPRSAALEWLDDGRRDDIRKVFQEGRDLGDFMHRPRQRADAQPATASHLSPRSERRQARIEPKPFVLQDPSTLPRRQWLYGTHLLRKEISATLAPGGVGKTSLGVAEAVALATGKPLMGVAVPRPMRVWLWNGEEPHEELMRRVHAVCLHYGIGHADLGGNLMVDNGHELPLVLAEQTRDGTTVYEPVVGALVAAMREHRIDVMICDPFVSTHNVTENDNNAIQKAATAWKTVAVGADVAIGLAHHTRKLNGREATAEDARGADSLIAKARDARALNPMSAEEARALSIAPSDRFEFFWTGPGGKSNMAKRTGRKTWFQMVSVGLGNAGGLNEPEDSVGVVVPWSPPEYRSEPLEAGALAALEAKMRDGMWRAATQKAGSADWVGQAVAEAFGIDRTKPGWEAEAKRLIRRLEAEGFLRTEKARDERQRKEVAVSVFRPIDDPADDGLVGDVPE